MKTTHFEAYFSPGEDCLNHIIKLIKSAQKHLEICVFTISDDRISRAILAAYSRGVSLRIITDNDKVWDDGSDIETLFNEGVVVKVDDTSYHMHHKFMLVDRKVLLTGSYNWTRAAAQYNQENVLSGSDPYLLTKFQLEF
jgi:phosphatidylserine/phosphatidylglycerophosphate/cardiolipin synthase-like enzyme